MTTINLTRALPTLFLGFTQFSYSAVTVLDFSASSNIFNTFASNIPSPPAPGNNFSDGLDSMGNNGQIVWEDIAPGIDLVAEFIGGTYFTNPLNGGLDPTGTNFGNVRLSNRAPDPRTPARFQFSIFQADTTTLLGVDEVRFGFLDLDGGQNASEESVTFISSDGSYSGYRVSSTSTLLIGGTTLQPSFTAPAPGNIPNPTFGTPLTTDQGNRAVEFVFRDVSTFQFDLFVADGESTRNFNLSGTILDFGDSSTVITDIPEPSTTLMIVTTMLVFFRRKR